MAGTAHIILAVVDDGTPDAHVLPARDPDDQSEVTRRSRKSRKAAFVRQDATPSGCEGIDFDACFDCVSLQILIDDLTFIEPCFDLCRA